MFGIPYVYTQSRILKVNEYKLFLACHIFIFFSFLHRFLRIVLFQFKEIYILSNYLVHLHCIKDYCEIIQYLLI